MKKFLYVLLGVFFVIILLMASGIRFDVSVERLKTKYTNQNSKFIDIGGLAVHYRDEGKGFPIVLLHGSPSSLHTWDGIVPELARHYRVIRPDLPGFGLTGPNAERDYSTDGYLRFLETFLNRINVDNFYIGGHSFGGRLAVALSTAKNDRVKKLILIAASGYPAHDEEIPAVQMAKSPLFRPLVRYVTPRFFIAMNLKQVFASENLSDETIDRYYELLLRKGNRDTFIAQCNQKEEDMTAQIRSLRVPTLIIWGSRDTTVSVQHAEHFHRDIPGSSLLLYDGIGHLPHETLPEKTASDILSFLQKETL